VDRRSYGQGRPCSSRLARIAQCERRDYPGNRPRVLGEGREPRTTGQDTPPAAEIERRSAAVELRTGGGPGGSQAAFPPSFPR